MKRSIVVVATCVALTWAIAASAATDEEKCLAGRAKAWDTYQGCLQTLLGKAPFNAVLNSVSVEKCRSKYTASWAKLTKLVDSSSCAGSRFTDNGTTFTDRLSTLIWEKKTTALDSGFDFNNPTDVDNSYALDFANPDDGAAYSDFLAKLNTYPGLANAMGWRLPTLAELLSISRDTLPGSTAPYRHQTTTNYQPDQSQAWSIPFDGANSIEARPKWGAAYFRAARGGL